MATIIKFPTKEVPEAAPPVVRVTAEPAKKVVKPQPASRESDINAASVIWHIAILCSPLIGFIFRWDGVYQFFRMLYYWDTPGRHSGLTFIFHLCLIGAFYVYLINGKPK